MSSLLYSEWNLKNSMRKFGAEVFKVKGNYEKSLIECIKQSTENDWQIVQDVAWKDYIKVPTYTMAGYTVMMREIIDQVNKEKISHIILQAGVGGLAASFASYCRKKLGYSPIIIIVEPEYAPCLQKSILKAKMTKEASKKCISELKKLKTMSYLTPLIFVFVLLKKGQIQYQGFLEYL